MNATDIMQPQALYVSRTLIVFAAIVAFLGFVAVLLYTLSIQPPIRMEPITCIMITGKDADRESLARLSITNFLEQSYPGPKRLLILNHGDFSLSDMCGASVEEIRVTKGNGKQYETLGALRNAALDMLSPGELWAVWDDDDYRNPQYLEALYLGLQHSRADLVSYTDRLEYNANTGLVWHSRILSGCVHVLGRMTPRVRYLHDKDTMEDERLISDYRAANLRVVVFQNKDYAILYVRLVHGLNNTSTYVQPYKSDIIKGSSNDNSYQEMRALKPELTYVSQLIIDGRLPSSNSLTAL